MSHLEQNFQVLRLMEAIPHNLEYLAPIFYYLHDAPRGLKINTLYEIQKELTVQTLSQGPIRLGSVTFIDWECHPFENLEDATNLITLCEKIRNGTLVECKLTLSFKGNGTYQDVLSEDWLQYSLRRTQGLLGQYSRVHVPKLMCVEVPSPELALSILETPALGLVDSSPRVREFAQYINYPYLSAAAKRKHEI